VKAEVEALIEELRRLRSSGVSRLSVSESALEGLRKLQASGALREQVLSSIPERVRSADARDFDKVVAVSASKAKGGSKPSPDSMPRAPLVEIASGDRLVQWKALKEQVLSDPVCCARARPRGKKLVFGVGNLEAELFFCGEAPGAEEEELGEPFAGKAGELLNKMIQATGLLRDQVYICNIVNWRPEMPTPQGSRPPTREEMAYCLPYLKGQLAIVKPKLIIALGANAAKGLLGAGSFRTLREVKGTWQEFEGVPVMPTYHPSYLLRNDTKRDKRAAWEDWLKVMERADLPISDRQRGYFL